MDSSNGTTPKKGNGTIEIATLGGGCFWCLEAVYENVEGIDRIISGYSGGTVASANYEEVSTGLTDHAEVVQLTFDSSIISFEDILEIFWTIHDPTTLNRQGNDVGRQYRSAIFYHNDQQKEIAEKSIAHSAPTLWKDPIVTEIEPYNDFFEAEAYHQNYYKNVGDRNPYCTFVISPKVQKLKKAFSERLKSEASKK